MKFAVKTLLLVSLAATFSYSQNNNILQIQHIIVMIQENRTPTNLFHEDATLVANGAHVIPPNNSAACGPMPTPPPNAHCTAATQNTTIALTALPLGMLNQPDPDHSHYPAWYCTYDGGAMDGACHISSCKQGKNCDASACPSGNLQYCPYTYAPNTMFNSSHGILDPYFNIAEQYGFANWMFQTNQGPSQEAHLFLFAGTSAPDYYNDPLQNCGSLPCWQWFAAENALVISGGAGCSSNSSTYVWELPPAPPQNPQWGKGYMPPMPPNSPAGYPCYSPYTLSDLLDTHVSWRYYAANNGFAYWNAPNMIEDICNNPNGGACNYPSNVKVGNPGLVLQDLGYNNQPCDLQQLTWVIPDGSWSDHPGTGATDGGPSWVAAIVNAVGNYTNFGAKLRTTPCTDMINGQQVPYWEDTVVLVVWDDWGGFYDDILPWGCGPNGVCQGYPNQPQSADYVYGFRVPLLVFGAYVKQQTNAGGYISGACPNGNCQGQEAPPHVHDFGSILNFIEYVFGSGGHLLGYPTNPTGIGPPQYPYADWLAPDFINAPGCSASLCPYGLYDFFNFTPPTLRSFKVIQGAKYDTSCFLSATNAAATSCFGANYAPSDPDDDLIDSQ